MEKSSIQSLREEAMIIEEKQQHEKKKKTWNIVLGYSIPVKKTTHIFIQKKIRDKLRGFF